MDYSTQELMIIAAAREIADFEVVFIGMRLPIMAYGVARLTHAPNAVGLFECGVARYEPADELLFTMADPANQQGAAWVGGLVQVMGLLHGGHADAGFIGGAEIDRFGNINTSYIGDFRSPSLKLPGSGGAPDIAAMAKRLVAIMNHEKRRLVERVDFITSTGYLDGAGSRARAGLAGGPSALITDRAILRPDGADNELHLASLHPGHDQNEVLSHTGWNLKPVAAGVVETAAPTKDELDALHAIDREGFWRQR